MTRKKSLLLEKFFFTFDPASSEAAVPFTVEKGRLRHQFPPECPYFSDQDACLRLNPMPIEDGRWMATYCFASFQTCPRYLGRPVAPKFRARRSPKKANR